MSWELRCETITIFMCVDVKPWAGGAQLIRVMKRTVTAWNPKPDRFLICFRQRGKIIILVFLQWAGMLLQLCRTDNDPMVTYQRPHGSAPPTSWGPRSGLYNRQRALAKAGLSAAYMNTLPHRTTYATWQTAFVWASVQKSSSVFRMSGGLFFGKYMDWESCVMGVSGWGER